MTKQEIFDVVLKGIMSQGGPSYDHDANSCAYRGENGRKCAAGWLMPDELFNPRFNMLIISDPEAFNMLPEDLRDFNTVPFIRQLQNIHDESQEGCFDDETFMDIWTERMRQFALDNDLRFNP